MHFPQLCTSVTAVFQTTQCECLHMYVENAGSSKLDVKEFNLFSLIVDIVSHYVFRIFVKHTQVFRCRKYQEFHFAAWEDFVS